MMHSITKLRSVVLALVAGLLAACSSSDNSQVIDDYEERLFRVLSIDVVDDESFQQSLVYSFPKTSKATLPESASTISVLDFLRLYGCELQVVIGERNSNLGKFAAESVELVQTLRFVQEAPECIAKLREKGNDELADQLAIAAKEKSANINVYLWNALLSGPEAYEFWRGRLTPNYPYDVGTEVVLSIEALSFVAEQLQDSELGNTELADLEKHLSVFRQGDGGALLVSIYVLEYKLERINKQLEHFLKSRADCINGKTRFDQHILQNVVTKFFVGEVQQWASALSQRYYQLLPPIEKIEQQLISVEPQGYQEWRLGRERRFEGALTVVRHHVSLLQALNQLCSEP